MDPQIPATTVGSDCWPLDGWTSSTSVRYRLASNGIDTPLRTAGSGNGLKLLELVPRPAEAVVAKRVTFVEGTGVAGLAPGKCAQCLR